MFVCNNLKTPCPSRVAGATPRPRRTNWGGAPATHFAAVALTFLLAALSQAVESQVATRINDFTLQDYLGAQHSLNEWQDKKAVVVVFVGTECPLAKRYGIGL